MTFVLYIKPIEEYGTICIKHQFSPSFHTNRGSGGRHSGLHTFLAGRQRSKVRQQIHNGQKEIPGERTQIIAPRVLCTLEKAYGSAKPLAVRLQ